MTPEHQNTINAISDGWDQAAKLLDADELTLDSLITIQHEFQKMATLLAVQIGLRQVEKMDTMDLMSLIASKASDDKDNLLDAYGDDEDENEND